MSAALAEVLSTAGGDLGLEVEEVEEGSDELPAGSAAEAVQANAEAMASEVIRVCEFRGSPFVGGG